MWTRARGLLIAAAILALAGVVMAAVQSSEQHSALDPRSPDGNGSRAAARILADHGVETTVVTSADEAAAAAGPDTTLLVAHPDVLNGRQHAKLAGVAENGGRTVLLAPGPDALGALTPGVPSVGDPATVEPTPPDCDMPSADRAGDAEMGGMRYHVSDEDAEMCYLRQQLPTLVRVPASSGNGDTVLLGTPEPLLNDRLDQHGNASLTLQLLGSRTHLVWYLPSLSDSAAADNEDRGFFDLIPDGWSWGALQLSLAALLAALWRARRLGPLVPERLPVSVRASEATEGRARLYRQANARDRAAHSLRAATRTRLAPLVGLPAAQAHSPEALTPALAARAGGGEADDATRIHTVLFGSSPTDDASLVRLADELDQLEHRFTRATSPPASPTAPPTDKDRTS
ncbi:DUF4350 domain-containing protein [Streptomyces armeniacus]|uniref:DUF4350 domain-containing protein n=1 Tax=Streptomyces armeniacus TaxID=83291 RepID=A0A345Y1L1_9ACTN|nr:DUF4350 domain-containing protein [Streptomyces armeniacus]